MTSDARGKVMRAEGHGILSRVHFGILKKSSTSATTFSFTSFYSFYQPSSPGSTEHWQGLAQEVRSTPVGLRLACTLYSQSTRGHAEGY